MRAALDFSHGRFLFGSSLIAASQQGVSVWELWAFRFLRSFRPLSVCVFSFSLRASAEWDVTHPVSDGLLCILVRCAHRVDVF